jgi:SAM-dependent methyltransferase
MAIKLEARQCKMLTILESKSGLSREQVKILDFGCHDGAVVRAMRVKGVNVSGVDIVDDKEEEFLELNRSENVRYVSLKNYRLPWADGSFDWVVSHHVLEHVVDHHIVLSEINRVLKPGGYSFHLFPSKYRVLEAHWYTPFGGVINNRMWFSIWPYVGLKKPAKADIKNSVYGADAYNYVRENTNYLSPLAIKKLFDDHYDANSHAEALYLSQLFPRFSMPNFLSNLVAQLIRLFHVNATISRKSLE